MTVGPGSSGRPADLRGLQLRFGRCDDLRAEIFVAVARPPAAGGAARLTGTLTGPECRRSWTLPTTAPLVDLGPGPTGRSATLLAQVVLTEPSFWTPELPSRYRLAARIVDGPADVGGCDVRIGLRRSATRGRSFWLEGRRWVPRGIAVTADEVSVSAFREAVTVAVVADPPGRLLEDADEFGVAVMAILADTLGRPLSPETMVERLVTWPLHASVVLAVVPGEALPILGEIVRAVGRRRGTMLLGVMLPGGEPPGEAPEGIDFLVVDLADGVPHPGWRESGSLPRVAWQRGLPPADAAPATPERPEIASRRGCDRLQADLAAWGLAGGRERLPWDWAGYVVTAPGPR